MRVGGSGGKPKFPRIFCHGSSFGFRKVDRDDRVPCLKTGGYESNSYFVSALLSSGSIDALSASVFRRRQVRQQSPRTPRFSFVGQFKHLLLSMLRCCRAESWCAYLFEQSSTFGLKLKTLSVMRPAAQTRFPCNVAGAKLIPQLYVKSMYYQSKRLLGWPSATLVRVAAVTTSRGSRLFLETKQHAVPARTTFCSPPHLSGTQPHYVGSRLLETLSAQDTSGVSNRADWQRTALVGSKALVPLRPPCASFRVTIKSQQRVDSPCTPVRLV